MNLTPVRTPQTIKKLFSNYVWEFPTTDKTIYLTFDDGPTPEITNWTLNELKKYDAKATFFCVGKNVQDHPEIYQNIIKDGHAIGNHTFSHVKGLKSSNKNYLENVNEAKEVLEKNGLNNHFVNLFRPPYGQILPNQGKTLIQLGYNIVMWNVLSFDWDKTITKERCLENVINNSGSGDIVVFHDSIKASKNMMYALPKTLEYFSKKGYSFKSIEI